MASRAFATGAALLSVLQGCIPVSTSATETYRTAQMISEAMMPNGTSCLGLRHSSAAVETESKPM